MVSELTTMAPCARCRWRNMGHVTATFWWRRTPIGDVWNAKRGQTGHI